MKKLVVLMLVVGMASLASAALTWSQSTVSIVEGSSATLQIVSSNNLAYSGGPAWVGAEPSTVAAISSIVKYAAAGPDAVANDPATTTYAGWWTISAVDADNGVPTWDVFAGDHWDVTIDGLVAGTYIIGTDDYQSAGASDFLTITVTAIPEPMTMALLGLGGLFLRRKK